MGFLTTRLKAVSAYFIERMRYGTPEVVGSVDREVMFILDGVGGFQFAPVLIRRALREQQSDVGTILYAWQYGLPGEIWTDLMWLRRNRVMGVQLARKLLALHRSKPHCRVHLVAFSGGAGIAVFALEALRGREIVETFVMLGPALSPEYNLGPALGAVRRAYALISERDVGILGLGTQVFGTTDRRFTRAAGLTGFRLPANLSTQDAEAYRRLGEIRWTPVLKEDGHLGGHTGWASGRLLCRHLLPLLHGEPLLPVHRMT